MAARPDVAVQTGILGSSRLSWRAPHPWHLGERVWGPTGGALDVWIELLHALEVDPAPVLLPTLATDFEGDQWTQPSIGSGDLWACYGIAVDDLVVWRTVLAHLVEQFDRGNVVLLDADLFHLPETSDGAYQREHTKTVIAATGYDRHAHRLFYIHACAAGQVSGADLDAILGTPAGTAGLPPRLQVVRLDRMAVRTPAERGGLAVALARFHGTRLPARNPVRAFGDALRAHGAWLVAGDADHYQRWAFATLHQCGATFEIAADVCSWLAHHGEPVTAAVASFRTVSHSARALHQRLVRVPQSGRMPDVSHTIDEMARAWDDAMSVLRPHYGA